MTADTASHSDAAPDTSRAVPADHDQLDRLRAALARGRVLDGQVRPLLELLDASRRAGGAEDPATVMYPGNEPLDLACRNGYVAASLLPALRVYETLAGAS